MDKQRSDLSGRFFKNLRSLGILINKVVFTLICSVPAKLKCISIGKGTTFNGRALFYRRPGSEISIGKKCHFTSNYSTNLIGVNRKCIIATHANRATLRIGDNCGFSGTVIGAFCEIIIENNVRCGANTLITDSDWHNDDPRTSSPAPVVIEENVWLGEGVKVLKGVTIGKNSVIGTSSVVTRSIPANVVAAGNPCKVIKNL